MDLAPITKTSQNIDDDILITRNKNEISRDKELGFQQSVQKMFLKNAYKYQDIFFTFVFWKIYKGLPIENA